MYKLPHKLQKITLLGNHKKVSNITKVALKKSVIAWMHVFNKLDRVGLIDNRPSAN